MRRTNLDGNETCNMNPQANILSIQRALETLTPNRWRGRLIENDYKLPQGTHDT